MHSYIPPERFFPYLTWTTVRDMPDKENVIIIQPMGAIEQHGPHLPLIVDTAIAMAVIGNALNHLDPDIPAYCLPPLCYGKSNEHWHFPGTMTLSAQTLMAVLTEVGESVYRAGFRKLLFLNAHGGQPQVIEIVARDLHQKYADLAIFPHFVWRAVSGMGTLLSETEKAYGIHAGDAETSVMLSLMPAYVDMAKAVREYPEGLPQESTLSMEGSLPFAWVTRDLSQSGIIGDATAASSAKGDQLMSAATQAWVKVLEDIYRFKLPSPSS